MILNYERSCKNRILDELSWSGEASLIVPEFFWRKVALHGKHLADYCFFRVGEKSHLFLNG
jgi:hypothetical protein